MWKNLEKLSDQYNFALEEWLEDKFIINYWIDKIVIEIWNNAMYYVNGFNYSSHDYLDIFEQIIKLQKIELSSIDNIVFPLYLYDEEYKDSNLVIFLKKYSVKFNEESFKRQYDDVLSKLSGPY